MEVEAMVTEDDIDPDREHIPRHLLYFAPAVREAATPFERLRPGMQNLEPSSLGHRPKHRRSVFHFFNPEEEDHRAGLPRADCRNH